MGLREEVRTRWRNGGMVVRLLLLNLGVFLLLLLTKLLLLASLQDAYAARLALKIDFLHWLEVPYSGISLLHRPWTLVTYMFTHVDVGHIFWNMVLLWFSGNLFADLLGPKRLLGTYLLGGLSGALLYLLTHNAFPFLEKYAQGDAMIGASASIMAILVGIATYRPGMLVNIFFIAQVKLVWVVVVLLLFDLAALSDASPNSGGHIAHLGGALYGYLSAQQLKKGRDWSLAFVSLFERIGDFFQRRRGRMRVTPGGRERVRVTSDDQWRNSRKARQERIDAILDKISRSGYDSLSKEEKDLLFRASNEK